MKSARVDFARLVSNSGVEALYWGGLPVSIMTPKNLQPSLSSGASRRHRTRKVWAEHSLVELASTIKVDAERSLPKGSVGAVVGVWQEGAAYEVEFNEPFHAVVTVPAPQLGPPPSSTP